jgi:hypothetical protein
MRFGAALIHAARDRLAMNSGFLKPCPAVMMAAGDNPQLSLL